MMTPGMAGDLEARRMRFDEHADNYQLARPRYPAQLYDILATECGLGAGTRVVEIGAGTGQATSDLLARGARVVAIEPGAALAARLTAELGGPALTVVCGDAETAPLADGETDLVVAATSFHWVRTEAVLPRLARALTPNGWLAVWWTIFGDPTNVTDFRWDLDEVYKRRLPGERHDPTEPWGPLYTDSWTAELEQGGWFTVQRVHQIRWTYELTPDRARRLFGSFSNVMALPEADRRAFLDELAGLVAAHGGRVADPYVTVLYLARPSGHELYLARPSAQ